MLSRHLRLENYTGLPFPFPYSPFLRRQCPYSCVAKLYRVWSSCTKRAFVPSRSSKLVAFPLRSFCLKTNLTSVKRVVYITSFQDKRGGRRYICGVKESSDDKVMDLDKKIVLIIILIVHNFFTFCSFSNQQKFK